MFIAEFRADRATYWRENAWLAAFAMAGGNGHLVGDPGTMHVWTGAVGGTLRHRVCARFTWVVRRDGKSAGT